MTAAVLRRAVSALPARQRPSSSLLLLQPTRRYLSDHLNGGSIEGVFIFHRHGDRCPARTLVAERHREAEAAFWDTKIPPEQSVFSALSELFPNDIHFSNNGGKFLDTKREPYGFLTYRGMEQMRMEGRRCAARYSQYGHQAPLRDNELQSDTPGRELLNYWDVKAYSTCYLRTVKSVQCFLHGLLGGNNQASYDEIEGDEKHDLLRAVIAEEVKESLSSEHGVTVKVRDRSNDTLNAFDRNPDLMKELVSEVVETPHFQRHDATAAALAARLSNLLPGLFEPGPKFFGGPSGINWIHAADHFVCRSSHKMKFSQFSENEHDHRVEQALAAMSFPTVRHLAWRFRQWYKSPPLLAAIAAPPLREIEEQIQNTVELGMGDRRPFVIYSCHDVTILSLLYGLGADFLEDDDEAGWRFWPSYATTLVIELVRVKEGKSDPDDTHMLRVMLNGNPVRVVSLRRKPDHDKILRISDFSGIIDGLEQDSGLGLKGRLNDDPACESVERDMSGWTG